MNGKGGPPKPRPLRVRPGGIPDELNTLPQWVVWRYVWNPNKRRKDGSGEKGDWDKPPSNARTGGAASSTDPATWSTFDEALAAYRSGEWDGIGVVLSEDLGIVGLDLDGCRDPRTGALEPWAREAIDTIKSYTEVSPSRTGVRIIARGSKPPGRCRDGRKEMYSSGRYLTITGCHLDSTPQRVRRRGNAIARLHAEWFPKPTEPAPAPSTNGKPHDLSDDEVIERAKAAKNGKKFARLWSGDTSGYASASEADLALCSQLRFWVGDDGDRINRLFRRSGLMREKWDRGDYSERTIKAALSGQSDHYGVMEPGERRRRQGGPRDERPTIFVSTDEHEVNAAAVEALAGDANVYQRGGVLSRVVEDSTPPLLPCDEPALRVVPLPPALLRERLAANAAWFQGGKKEGEGLVRVHPPGWCISAVHARGSWEGVRHLTGVTEFPALRPDGSLLLQPGYDPATGLYYAPNCAVPEVPGAPTYDDARAACRKLLGLVCDFPFVARYHKSAWLCGLLTPLARLAVRGDAPLFLATGNNSGVGKGLLFNAVGHILTGADVPVQTYTDDLAELQKHITSVAIGGHRIVRFDNVVGNFGNAVLDAALTCRGKWTGRVLGTNQLYTGPLVATWLATGNNLTLGGDIHRRVCPIRLQTDLERPETRDDFRHKDLLGHIDAYRPELLGAALTLLRAFVVAGRPAQKFPPWGSYESWSGLVRAAVVWCGMPDPYDGVEEMRLDSADPSAAAMAALLRLWPVSGSQGAGLTASEVVARTYRPDDHRPKLGREQLASTLEELVGTSDVMRMTRLLGNKLRDHSTRNLGGRRVVRSTQIKGNNRWLVQRLDQGSWEPVKFAESRKGRRM